MKTKKRQQVDDEPLGSLDDAIAEVISAACYYRDVDWKREDYGKAIEQLDRAVDRYRRLLRVPDAAADRAGVRCGR